MDFRRSSRHEEPEVNLIPMIDVLLVIVIFLSVTTTYSRFSELQINLPRADAEKPLERPEQITVVVDPSGRYVVNRTPVAFTTVDSLAVELKKAAGQTADPVIIINADATATHQSVIQVMEAARAAGYNRITFTTQSRTGAK